MNSPSQLDCTTSAELICGTRLTKTYGAGNELLTVVRDASCVLRAGELMLLMGPSGSGKTTLLSMLGGLTRPTSGSVTLCGHQLDRYDEAKSARVRRQHVGFIFQGYRLFPALSALDNVAEILAMRGLTRGEARTRALAVLSAVGLGERVHHRPAELSGGQQQRVAIARAIATRPSVILGDEVTAALDGESAIAVMELLRAYTSATTAVLLVTHDQRLSRYADRVLPLTDGRLS
jgi:ABC-type lipoprotein export system ATPase subunit